MDNLDKNKKEVYIENVPYTVKDGEAARKEPESPRQYQNGNQNPYYYQYQFQSQGQNPQYFGYWQVWQYPPPKQYQNQNLNQNPNQNQSLNQTQQNPASLFNIQNDLITPIMTNFVKWLLSQIFLLK